MGKQFEDFFLFDEYAILLRDRKQIKVIYFRNFLGQTVPPNYEVPLYNEL